VGKVERKLNQNPSPKREQLNFMNIRYEYHFIINHRNNNTFLLKGPPNANKSQNSSNASSTETSYELLLQQQQLFLQWQLEWQQKYPQILLPAVNVSLILFFYTILFLLNIFDSEAKHRPRSGNK